VSLPRNGDQRDQLGDTERDEVVERIRAKAAEARERYLAKHGGKHAGWRERKRAKSSAWASFFAWCDERAR
jgi:alpha-beta hydrolase superfamily lysophospholipase